MKRKKRGLFAEIAASPWWVGVAFGVIGYPVLRWLVPWLVIDHPLLNGIAGGMEVVALVWLVACFGASGLSLLQGLLRRSLYERTRDADDLSGLSWQHFEKLVGEYFRRQGFQVRETGSPAGDGGVDLLLFRRGERHVVQCKHWKARQVGVAVVRELIGTVRLTGAVSGYLVTSGAVTEAAADAAREGDVRIVSGAEILGVSNKGRSAALYGLSEASSLGLGGQLLANVGVILLVAAAALGAWQFMPGYLGRVIEQAVISGYEPVSLGEAPVTGARSSDAVDAGSDSVLTRPESTGRGEGIYRWRDDEENLHYGDSPPAGVEFVRMPDNLDEQNVVGSSGQ